MATTFATAHREPAYKSSPMSRTLSDCSSSRPYATSQEDALARAQRYQTQAQFQASSNTALQVSHRTRLQFPAKLDGHPAIDHRFSVPAEPLHWRSGPRRHSMPHVQSAPAPLHMAADSTMQYGDMVKQSGHFHPEQARHGQLGQRDLARLSPRPRRKKIMPEQLDVLINVFALSTTLSFEDREQLARRLGMTNREVQVWFQNRRAKVSRERQQEDQSPAWLQESPSSDSSPDSPPHESRHMVDHAVKPFGSSRPSMQGIERSRSDQRPYMRACPASDDRIIIRSPPSTGSTPGTHAAFTPSSAYATSASSQSGTPHSMDIKRDSYFPSLTRTTSEARAEGYFSGTVPRLPDPRSNFLGLRTKSAPNAVTLPPPWAAGGPSRPAGPRPHEPDGVARRAEGRDGINLLADIAIDTLAREKRRA